MGHKLSEGVKGFRQVKSSVIAAAGADTMEGSSQSTVQSHTQSLVGRAQAGEEKDLATTLTPSTGAQCSWCPRKPLWVPVPPSPACSGHWGLTSRHFYELWLVGLKQQWNIWKRG